MSSNIVFDGDFFIQNDRNEFFHFSGLKFDKKAYFNNI